VRSNPLDLVAIVRLSRATYQEMMQNLLRATGYDVVALPLVAGASARSLQDIHVARRVRPPSQEEHLDRWKPELAGRDRDSRDLFRAVRGLYVLHCHNLEHEDAGMTLNLEVS
jgi:hypothetical protein